MGPNQQLDAKEQRRRLYEAQALKYQDEAHAALAAFDKAILTLSAGALGLSLVFIKDVVPLATAIFLDLLSWSWGLLGASIVLTLVTFILSHQAFEDQKRIAYRYYIEEHDQAIDERSPWALATRYLTHLAGGCFVAALLFTLVFAIQNVRHASVMIKTIQEKSVVDENGPAVSDSNHLERGVQPSGLVKVPLPNRVVAPNTSAPVKPPQNQNPSNIR